MNYLPPLRHYQQMVRVVKEDGTNTTITSHSFKLGNAFGQHLDNVTDRSFLSEHVSPTEQRLRTLEVMNLPSGSLRDPGIERRGGVLPTRSATTHFHQLNDSTQRYFDGRGGQPIQNRQELEAGTKLRTQLTPWAENKPLYKNTLTTHSHHPSHIDHSEKAHHRHHTSHFSH